MLVLVLVQALARTQRNFAAEAAAPEAAGTTVARTTLAGPTAERLVAPVRRQPVTACLCWPVHQVGGGRDSLWP